MNKAGSREKQFQDLISLVDSEILKGKIDFGHNSNVYVSVDESIEFEDKIFLIEIDASNMAKLVAGQFTLLNLLKNKQNKNSINRINCACEKELIFLVVHCYGQGSKVYNPQRSLKNFKFIAESCFPEGLRFGSVHMDELITKIPQLTHRDELEEYLETIIYN
ncbi:MAG: hypothetical protein ABJ092_14265 [Gillisia sp.]